MTLFNHHLKRLPHERSSLGKHKTLPTDEKIREAIRNLCFPSSTANISRSFKPGPNHARRGGARARNQTWHPSVSLPRRAINYDLAESFVDHSTNPLLSDLYKIRFKHSSKQWPNGRFINYTEKIDKLDGDGNLTDVTCTRTFPLVAKRKMTQETNQNTTDSTSLLVLIDPAVQQQKKKLADKQTNLYANLFGIGKIPRFSSAVPIKKTNDSTT